MSSNVIKPSEQHYQDIFRVVFGIIILGLMYYNRDYVETNPVTVFLFEDRRFISSFAIVFAVVFSLALAIGIDRAMLPLLKKISSKPSIELRQSGLRFLYDKAHADLLFESIQRYKLDTTPEWAITLFTHSGHIHELKDYRNMQRLIDHIRQGVAAQSSEDNNPENQNQP